jgi:hypothetical protein
MVAKRCVPRIIRACGALEAALGGAISPSAAKPASASRFCAAGTLVPQRLHTRAPIGTACLQRGQSIVFVSPSRSL